MWVKKKIRNAVYHLYLSGVPTDMIQNLFHKYALDIDEIIDYMNEIYN
jgi:hypothetical protein